MNWCQYSKMVNDSETNIHLEFYTTDCLFKTPIVLDEPDQLDKSKCIHVIMKV